MTVLRRFALATITGCVVAAMVSVPPTAAGAATSAAPVAGSLAATAAVPATTTARDKNRKKDKGTKGKGKKGNGNKGKNPSSAKGPKKGAGTGKNGKDKKVKKPPPVRGTAIVRVTGATTRARITLTGPGSFRRVLRSSGRVNGLAPGSYAIAAQRIVRRGGIVSTRVVNRRFRVSDKRRLVTARVVYDFTPTPGDRQPPAPVTGLIVRNRGADSVELGWSVPTDPDLAGIMVRRTLGTEPVAGPNRGAAVDVEPDVDSGVVDRAVRPETVYTYSVFTRDTSGNVSAAPRSVTVRTAVSQVFAVGDVGWCGGGTADTARLIPTGSPLLGLGDMAYFSGTAEDFRRCYDPHYGRLRNTTYPTPGNHEYRDGARGYRTYFGPRTGTRAKPWYVVRFGSWRILMLDSDCTKIGGCGARSRQYRWVQQTLDDHPSACLAAAWHHPQWVTGANEKSWRPMTGIYRLLENAGADFVLTGHLHRYERFARASASGFPSATGIRQFVVGTGGAPLKQIDDPLPTLESVFKEYGVLRLSLDRAGYSWQFVAAGDQIRDSGSDVCNPA